jgi:hypothetical protein
MTAIGVSYAPSATAAHSCRRYTFSHQQNNFELFCSTTCLCVNQITFIEMELDKLPGFIHSSGSYPPDHSKL